MRRLSILVLLIGLAVTSRADAQEAAPPAPAPESEAAALLRQASDLYANEADCGRALPLFEASFRLEPGWLALSGMARCHELMGRTDVAFTLYQRIIHDYGDQLDERRRQRLEARIAALDVQLPQLDVHTSTPRATVSVDGRAVTRFPIRVVAGVHELVVVAPEHMPRRESVTLAPGEHARLDLALVPIARAEALPRRRSPWIWRSVAISGVAVAAAGGVLLAKSHQDFDRFDDEIIAYQQSDTDEPINGDLALLDRARRERDIGIVLAGAGIVTVSGALLLRAWTAPDEDRPAPALTLTPGGVGVGMTWSY
jgi:hypothetical protein